ncbi:ribokinase [Bacillus sp. FJAT-50079]|uniref:ribokinase n=1 Tax=Bacillus sp. FJAT-50079 TaxID=2833577 RepID=UPI001BC99ADD|nr:ribokinase [Bacillus sp. FJAT-50079]MBS4206984.1 ribokinase [Bacillus sp. FJAT-50079]
MAEITVVGSINMDIVALTSRYPRHGETIFGDSVKTLCGGKGANQAIACARLGKSVNIIGSIGIDSNGQEIEKNFKENQIDTTFLKRVDNVSTGCAIITVDATAENTMLVVKGANDLLTEQDVRNAFSQIKNNKILLVQMEIPEEAVICAMTEAKNKGMFIILDPAPAEGVTKKALLYADVITPNLQETKQLTGIDVTSIETAIKAAKYLEQHFGVKNSVIKMAEKGALVYENGNGNFIESIRVKAIDTVGAGDSYAGALACALADGESLESAARFAAIVAALKVSKLGAQKGLPTIEEINVFCAENNLNYYGLQTN